MTKLNNEQNLYIIVIMIAGFCFSAVEVCLFRAFNLETGATILASSLILSGFMLGQGIGAYFITKLKVNYYLFLKIISINLFLLAIISAIYPYLFSNILGFFQQQSNFLYFLFVFFSIFIPTTIIGTVLPSISSLYIKQNSIDSKIGKIYSFETLGATLGGLFAGFLFISQFGQSGTFYLISGLLIIVSLLLFFIKSEPKNINNEDKTVLNSNRKRLSIDQKKLLAITFTYGFVMLAIQVVWMKFFKVYFTNTSYSFSLITSMVIFGIFLGSTFYQRKFQKIKNTKKTLEKLLLYFILTISLSTLLLVLLPKWLLFPFGQLIEINWIRILLIPFLASIFVIIPVSFISGFSFPLIIGMFHENNKKVNYSVGIVLLSNTFGAALGPIFILFLLLPIFNLVSTIFFLILFISIVSIIYVGFGLKLKPQVVFLSFIILSTILLLLNPAVHILPPSFHKINRKVLAYGETVEGIYVVGREQQNKQAVLSTYVNNSAVIGSSYDAIKAVKIVGHLPFFVSQKEIENVLIVGFGIGTTTAAIASHSEVKKIDCVELIPELAKVSHYYSNLNNNIVKDKRFNIHKGDGRNYIKKSEKKFDLISSDPTHPILGSGNLYTYEYFELCRNHLADDGVISQYLPLHKLLLKDLLSIIKSFDAVFPNSSLWIAHNHGVLLGNKSNKKIDFENWIQETNKVNNDIYFYNNPYHLASCFFIQHDKINEISKDINLCTDDKNSVEFFKFSSLNEDNLSKNLEFLNQNRQDPLSFFSNVTDTAMMSKFQLGNYILTEGVVKLFEKKSNDYRNKLIEATQKNPENQEYPFLIKYYFN